MMEVCNRCLIVQDARMASYVAQWKDGGADFPPHRQPRQLEQWVEETMIKSGGDARFSLGSLVDVLIPVTTWQGDPVCLAHLWELRERELRAR